MSGIKFMFMTLSSCEGTDKGEEKDRQLTLETANERE
jgi:hypothetical protein